MVTTLAPASCLPQSYYAKALIARQRWEERRLISCSMIGASSFFGVLDLSWVSTLPFF